MLCANTERVLLTHGQENTVSILYRQALAPSSVGAVNKAKRGCISCFGRSTTMGIFFLHIMSACHLCMSASRGYGLGIRLYGTRIYKTTLMTSPPDEVRVRFVRMCPETDGRMDRLSSIGSVSDAFSLHKTARIPGVRLED